MLVSAALLQCAALLAHKAWLAQCLFGGVLLLLVLGDVV
jgi:hypothetical protein